MVEVQVRVKKKPKRKRVRRFDRSISSDLSYEIDKKGRRIYYKKGRKVIGHKQLVLTAFRKQFGHSASAKQLWRTISNLIAEAQQRGYFVYPLTVEKFAKWVRIFLIRGIVIPDGTGFRLANPIPSSLQEPEQSLDQN